MLKYGYLYWYCHTKTLLSWLPQLGFKRILIKSKAYILKFINELVEKFGPDLLLLFFLLSGYLPVTLKLSAFFPHVHLHKPIGLSESFVTSYLAVFVYIFSVQIYFRSVGQYFRVSYLRQPSCCSSHSWKKKKSVWLFVTPWTTAHQASVPFTISQSLLKLMSIELVMPSSHLILSSPSPHAFNPSQHWGLFQWVSSSHQVAKVLGLQLQHQSFQWIFRTDFL